MRDVLDPLAQMPGVRLVSLVTLDGVPIVVPGRFAAASDSAEIHVDAVAALATAWLDDLSRTLSSLSWEAPRRVALRAARGSLVLHGARGAVLIAVLDPGVAPAEVRLAMDGAVLRLDRNLRGPGAEIPQTPPEGSIGEPLAPLPLARREGRVSSAESAGATTDDRHYQAGT